MHAVKCSAIPLVIDSLCNGSLINAGGILNKWQWPKIEGIKDFKGPLLHSARWDDTVDLKDKTVAIIGSGSSSIQIVPKIQALVKRL